MTNQRKFIFSHRYLHDGESLYWLLIYMLCSFAPKFVNEVMDVDSNERVALFDCYLPSTCSERYDALALAGADPRSLSTSIPTDTCIPIALSKFGKTLGAWIIGQYRNQLHPSISIRSNPGAVEPKVTEASLLKAIARPIAGVPRERRPLVDCGFVQNDFKHIFPGLRQQFTELKGLLRYDWITKMARTRARLRARLSDVTDPLENVASEYPSDAA